MTRAERLLHLIQALRRRRHPVSGATLASELGISLRTLYRDIATLQAGGAPIEGERGVGYLLRPGFMLPPLMFTEDELEALVLGARWVAQRAGKRLGAAADDLLAKISAVLPEDLRFQIDNATLLVGPARPEPSDDGELSLIRRAIRTERKIELLYRDLKGEETRRTVWPFAIGFFDGARIIAAWCEMRQGFRHFRTDRILSVSVTNSRYPRHRQALLKDWHDTLDPPPQLPETDSRES
ncbi:MAG: YafY family transcriptional regulator [Telmatospirillum sp.]|nr:YafY family transcriptional regulator [Telmatospirillum sp.]